MPTFKLAKERYTSLRNVLESCDFSFSQPAHTVFQAKYGKCSITLYNSGKLLVQGKESDNYLQMLFAEGILTPPEPTASCWIGVDEAGKGDLFGPLVIAGVGLTEDLTSIVYENGVRDSKDISPPKIKELAGFIRKTLPYEIVTIMPAKYNQLYDSFRNLNKLLGWGHGKVFENLCSKCEPEKAVFDQFANKSLLDGILSKKGKDVKIIQKTKGESDLAVACASILARAEFVSRVWQLSDKAGVKLPLGGGDPAKQVARKMIESKGREFFASFGKAHFKI